MGFKTAARIAVLLDPTEEPPQGMRSSAQPRSFIVSAFITAIAALLIIHCVVRPGRASIARAKAAQFEREYRALRLHALQCYYPSLSKLSFRDIERRYDVEALYQRIGDLQRANLS
jgi:hypothetical protein